jgi:uncharacterized protein (TIGR02996 family)
MPRYKFPPDELSFLSAIHATPWEDAPRLVYADWLQEHDQADYAEFIRWQCQRPIELKIPRPSAKTLERWRVESPSDNEEKMRQRLGLNFGLWGRPFPSDTDLEVFHRGLPIIRIRWVLSERAVYDRLLKANPRLRFQFGLDDTTLDFLRHPVLARADAITFGPANRAARLTNESIIALSRWPGIGSVRIVNLWGIAEPERVQGLFPSTVTLNITI